MLCISSEVDNITLHKIHGGQTSNSSSTNTMQLHNIMLDMRSILILVTQRAFENHYVLAQTPAV